MTLGTGYGNRGAFTKKNRFVTIVFGLACIGYILIDLTESGMTMICVTHEMGFAKQVADRVVFMDEGAIVESNKPVPYFENPQSERTRKFLSQVLVH